MCHFKGQVCNFSKGLTDMKCKIKKKAYYAYHAIPKIKLHIFIC